MAEGKVSLSSLTTEGEGTTNVFGIVGGVIGAVILVVLVGCFLYKYCSRVMKSEVASMPSEARLNIINEADAA
jgi:hypothetical protein